MPDPDKAQCYVVAFLHTIAALSVSINSLNSASVMISGGSVRNEAPLFPRIYPRLIRSLVLHETDVFDDDP